MGQAITCVVVVLTIAACGRSGFDDVGDGPDAGVAVDAGDDGIARITIDRSGTGVGTIVGPDGFTCTAASCELSVPAGTQITLRGLAATESWFGGWTGACGGTFDCTFTATTRTITAEFAPTPNRMFVTSTFVTGALGGRVGANGICAARAGAAGLTGTFVAFLSDDASNAMTKVVGSRGWVRTDGAPFADSSGAFATAFLFPPRLDEFGTDVGNSIVFTGTSRGATTATHCANWTSALAADTGGGTRTHYAGAAVEASGRACDTSGRLLCVEIDRNVPVTVKRDDDSKLAFSTRGLWTPGNGRGSADALCATEAASAGHAGTFLAAMATTTESMASRFVAGATYRRVDGVRLYRSAGMFLTDFLDVPPELDALGGLVDKDFWTGTRRWSNPGSSADTCGDWSIGTAAVSGAVHATAYTDIGTSAKTDACNKPYPLLCLAK